MQGSFAILARPNSGNGNGSIELHVNLWRLDRNTNALDVGLKISDAKAYERLGLFIPGAITADEVTDLSGVLEDRRTLSAVFNETLDVGQTFENEFEARTPDQTYLWLARMTVVDDLEFAQIEDQSEAANGTFITVKESVLSRMKKNDDYYIRLRISLSPGTQNLCITENAPSDRLLGNTFYDTDLIEFRVNERRCFGVELRRTIAEGSWEIVNFNAVHFFLVRHNNAELVRSHEPFRKMRRLESGLWDRYVRGLGALSPDNFLIYHWRRTEPPVTDFSALATFREQRTNVFWFVTGIVLLGSMGSQLQWVGFGSWGGEGPWWRGAITLVVGALLLYPLTWLSRLKRGR